MNRIKEVQGFRSPQKRIRVSNHHMNVSSLIVHATQNSIYKNFQLAVDEGKSWQYESVVHPEKRTTGHPAEFKRSSSMWLSRGNEGFQFGVVACLTIFSIPLIQLTSCPYSFPAANCEIGRLGCFVGASCGPAPQQCDHGARPHEAF